MGKLFSFLLIFFLFVGAVEANEVKIIPLNGSVLVYGTDIDSKKVNCNDNQEFRFEYDSCSKAVEISRISCTDQLKGYQTELKAICDKEKELLKKEMECTDKVVVIDNKNETEGLRGVISDKNSTISTYKWGFFGVFMLFLITLVVVIIVVLNKKKPVTRKCLIPLLFLFVLLPFAKSEAFTTNIVVNVTNNSIIILTESQNITYPLITNIVYPATAINLVRNSTCNIQIYNYTYNNTVIINQSIYNYTNDFYNTTTITNSYAQPAIQTICPEINYSKIQGLNIDLSEPNNKLDEQKKMLLDVKTTTNNIWGNIETKRVESTESSDKKEIDWSLWILIIGIVVFLIVMGVIAMLIIKKFRNKNKQGGQQKWQS